MSELFSADWMSNYAEAWNNEPELAGELEKIDFNSTIAYGFPDDEQPAGVLVVEKGKAVKAGSYSGEALNWDLRASNDSWQKWMGEGIGMTGLGIAFTSGKLKFKVGDYKSMLKDPRMAGPFIKSFSVMGKA